MKFDQQEVELRVGDTVVIDQVRVTVIGITDGEVTFEVLEPAPHDVPVSAAMQTAIAADVTTRPR